MYCCGIAVKKPSNCCNFDANQGFSSKITISDTLYTLTQGEMIIAITPCKAFTEYLGFVDKEDSGDIQRFFSIEKLPFGETLK